MSIELPPCRTTPDEWSRMHIRKYGWRIGLASGVVLLLLMWPVLSFLGVSIWLGVAFAVATGALSPLNHFYETRKKLRKETGLPWEEQRTRLTDDSLVTVYESGFEIKVPWSKIRRIRSVPEGLLLDIEGSSLLFLPARALTPESRAFLKERVST